MSHTVGKVMHWIASVYIVAVLTVAVLAVIALAVWGIVVSVRHLADWWPSAAALTFIGFSVWAANKVQDDGMAWEKEAQSDDLVSKGEG